MKKHLIGLFIGMVSIWMLTAFLYAEINPFNLPTDVRQGMVAGFIFCQFLIQVFIGIYNANKL